MNFLKIHCLGWGSKSLDANSILNKLFPDGRGGGSKEPPWIVLGLGNPGPEYKNTRHNVGWWCLDELVKRSGATINRKRKELAFAQVELHNMPTLLAYPMMMMNRSGIALNYLANRFKTPAVKIIVITDDIHLKPGSIRVRDRGGAGGHNGLKSIISALGTENFPRVRIGVGKPQYGIEQVDHVLGKFDPENLKLVKLSTDRAADAVTLIINNNIESAMNTYNSSGDGNPVDKQK